MNIGEYKNRFKYLETIPRYHILALSCTLKRSVKSQKSCVTIPKKLRDNPKKNAYGSQKKCLTIPKKMSENCPADLYSSVQLIFRHVFGKSYTIPENIPDN